ncbi:MAG: tetratricopeptide repeat protein [Nannocystaceae bacterium]|nr:tetratricopeptide repeat protein [Nannocystaceae bacterium]
MDSRDPKVALCMVGEVSSRTDVILRAPAAIVLEEAMRTGPITYRIAIGFHGRRDPSMFVDPPVSERTGACLLDAFRPKSDEDLRSERISLAVFSQQAWGVGGNGAHQHLANEAAVLGWIELERGHYEGALAFFEDAFWLYHRPEYEFLQAMALQKMGRPNMAVTRYRRFMKARPHAPETPMLRSRVAQLEAARDPAFDKEESVRPNRAR